MEDLEKKIKYPFQVFFILGNEFCERFSYYGMRTVLSLYLRDILGFTEDVSTVLFHAFVVLCYFSPIFGAILSDSYIGKFKTIFYISIVYAAGNILLAVSAIPITNYPQVPMSFLGLVLIGLGTGGIKPCVAAFGGDQFVLPQQEKQLATFFSIFYFSINLGSMFSTVLTPILRHDVTCFDMTSCYPLAFGMPAGLFIVALALFLVGRVSYKVTPPTGSNLFVKVIKCISLALKKKDKNNPKEHWLDNAESEEFDRQFITDIKCVLRVLFLYIPLPIFWALFDQQGSRWTFQATRMDGHVGGTTIKPDQMLVANAGLILVFIPLFDYGVYPLFAKFNLLKKPLQRMGVGMFLAGTAFVVSALIEIQLEKSYPDLPAVDEAHLSITNALDCPFDVQISEANVYGLKTEKSAHLTKNTHYSFKHIKPSTWSINVDIKNCDKSKGKFYTDETNIKHSVTSKSGDMTQVLVYVDGSVDSPKLKIRTMKNDDFDKDIDGNPKIRFMYNIPENINNKTKVKVKVDKKEKHDVVYDLTGTIGVTEYQPLEPKTVEIWLKSNDSDSSYHLINDELDFQLGVVDNVMMQQLDGMKDLVFVKYMMTEANTMNMFWLMPQYIVMTSGEILFSITGLNFSFDQAPNSMKSVMQACWLLTVAVGNLLDVLIASLELFEKQTYEFFLFAGMIYVFTLIFSYMAWKYVPYAKDDDNEMDEQNSIKGTDNTAYDDKD